MNSLDLTLTLLCTSYLILHASVLRTQPQIQMGGARLGAHGCLERTNLLSSQQQLSYGRIRRMGGARLGAHGCLPACLGGRAQALRALALMQC